MFTAEYNDTFYHAVRDALHAEVDSWRNQAAREQVASLWQRVTELEPISRNPSPTRFRMETASRTERFLAVSPTL